MPRLNETPPVPTPVQCHHLGELRNRHIRDWNRAGEGMLVVQQQSYRIARNGWLLTAHPLSQNADPYLKTIRKTLETLDRDVKKENRHCCRHGDPKVNLNGVARATTDGAPIRCERLAAHYLDDLLSGPLYRPNFGQLCTVERIQASVGTTAQRVQTALHRVCKLRMVETEDWGKEFARQFKKMDRRGEGVRGLSLLTFHHACAVGLKLKRRPGEERATYGVTFYDPNRTATHWRIKYDDLSDVEGISADRFLTPEELSLYCENGGNTTVMMAVNIERMQSLRGSPQAPGPIPRPLSGDVPAPSPTVLCHLISLDCVDGLQRIATALLALPEGERVRCLGHHGEIPPLFTLMRRGHPDTLMQFGRLLEGLCADARGELLMGRHADGRTALYIALIWPRHGMVRPYWNLVRTLPEEWHFPLMRAQNGAGTSVLHIACERGRVDVLKAMFEVMKDMPVPLRVNLLMAYSGEGECGLAAAAKAGHSEIIEAYSDILGSMPAQARREVLRPLARWARGEAGAPQIETKTLACLRGLLFDHAPGLLLTPSFVVKTLLGRMGVGGGTATANA